MKKKFLIAINRDIASGGTAVAEALSDRLQIKYMNAVKLEKLAERFGLTQEDILEQKKTNAHWWNEISDYYQSLVQVVAPESKFLQSSKISANEENILKSEKQLLREFLKHESIIAVGRATYAFFNKPEHVLRVFLYCDTHHRVQHYLKKYGGEIQVAQEMLEAADQERTKFVKKYYKLDRYDIRNYDLVINISHGHVEQAVNEIVQALKDKKIL